MINFKNFLKSLNLDEIAEKFDLRPSEVNELRVLDDDYFNTCPLDFSKLCYDETYECRGIESLIRYYCAAAIRGHLAERISSELLSQIESNNVGYDDGEWFWEVTDTDEDIVEKALPAIKDLANKFNLTLYI